VPTIKIKYAKKLCLETQYIMKPVVIVLSIIKHTSIKHPLLFYGILEATSLIIALIAIGATITGLIPSTTTITL